MATFKNRARQHNNETSSWLHPTASTISLSNNEHICHVFVSVSFIAQMGLTPHTCRYSLLQGIHGAALVFLDPKKRDGSICIKELKSRARKVGDIVRLSARVTKVVGALVIEKAVSDAARRSDEHFVWSVLNHSCSNKDMIPNRPPTHEHGHFVHEMEDDANFARHLRILFVG